MQGLLITLAVLVLIGIGFAALIRKIRSAESRRSRRWWLTGTISLGVILIVLIGTVLVGAITEQRGASRPIPDFSSLTSDTDDALVGKVAYVSQRKDVTAKTFDACATVSATSGATTTDLTCWPFDPQVPVTVRWVDPGTLEVTAWDRSAKPAPKAIWSKRVTTDGKVTSSPAERAVMPSSAGSPAPDGESLTSNDHDGNVTVTLTTPSGSRTLLDVRDAQIWWHLIGASGWSPDGRWIANVDSSDRLLITTTSGSPQTRILATEVVTMAGELGTPAFAVAPAPAP